MTTFHGIAVSPGICMGAALVIREDVLPVPRYEVRPDAVEQEYSRFVAAVDSAASDLETLRRRRAGRTEEVRLLDAHLLMLADPEFRDRVRQDLERKLLNAEWILLELAEDYTSRLGSSDEEYMRDRVADIHDVRRRITDHLMHRERISLEDIERAVVLVAHNLMPSDAIMLNPALVRGLAMDIGGRTSHTAILARSFGIPAVLGLRDATQHLQPEERVALDGNQGLLIGSPDGKTLARYERARTKWLRHEADLDDLSVLPAQTRDGRRLLLDANIETAAELDAVLSHGADGIGLYRSEFLYLLSRGEPSEEEQFLAYRSILERMRGKPVTIRTFDLGGEKDIPGLTKRREENPILGWRAIRYCLAHPRLFEAQLTALLRASVFGDLRIMFPMISGIEELEAAMEVLERVRGQLQAQGIDFAPDVPLGIMIETPSAALTADILARRVSFFSIGTNDLIQYTLAVDRGNEKTAYLYEPFHTAVLRLLRDIVRNAHAEGISVGLCGELAGDPASTLILLGLELDELSMSSFGIPEVKRIVRSVTMEEARKVASDVLAMESFREADRYIARLLEERFGIVSQRD